MKRIVKERKKKEMTQSDLAFTLRIQPAQLSKIENGRSLPYRPTEKKLEDFFNMDIEKLLEEVD
jgi:ribosome-binding protein aMBF1 (putative translation factor)